MDSHRRLDLLAQFQAAKVDAGGSARDQVSQAKGKIHRAV